jgi:hypothetical protein
MIYLNILLGIIIILITILIIRINKVGAELDYWERRTRQIEERFSALDKHLELSYRTEGKYEDRKE